MVPNDTHTGVANHCSLIWPMSFLSIKMTNGGCTSLPLIKASPSIEANQAVA